MSEQSVCGGQTDGIRIVVNAAQFFFIFDHRSRLFDDEVGKMTLVERHKRETQAVNQAIDQSTTDIARYLQEE